jgi:hypothetical protein
VVVDDPEGNQLFFIYPNENSSGNTLCATIQVESYFQRWRATECSTDIDGRLDCGLPDGVDRFWRGLK